MSIVIPVGEDLNASVTNSHAAEYHYNSGGGQGRGGDRGVMAKEDINSANGCNGVGMCDKNAEVLKA